jgi:hypothetical protein
LNPVHGEVYSIQHYEVYLNFPINQEIENWIVAYNVTSSSADK